MSYSLDSLNGAIQGTILGVTEGDTRSLDYSSCAMDFYGMVMEKVERFLEISGERAYIYCVQKGFDKECSARSGDHISFHNVLWERVRN